MVSEKAEFCLLYCWEAKPEEIGLTQSAKITALLRNSWLVTIYMSIPVSIYSEWGHSAFLRDVKSTFLSRINLSQLCLVNWRETVCNNWKVGIKAMAWHQLLWLQIQPLNFTSAFLFRTMTNTVSAMTASDNIHLCRFTSLYETRKHVTFPIQITPYSKWQ